MPARSRRRSKRGTPVRGPYAWWLMTSRCCDASGWSQRMGLSASTANGKKAAPRTPQARPALGAVDRAAQADLDRVGHIHEALLNGAAHPRAVVVLLAEVAVPGVGVGGEVDHRDRAARARGAQVGQRAGVIAADQQRDDAGLDQGRGV